MLKFLQTLKILINLVIIGCIALILYRAIKIAHKMGYEQGVSDSKFACEQEKAAMVDEAVRSTVGR